VLRVLRDEVVLCARGAQQQAAQQEAGEKKRELAELLELHVMDYKQIFWAPQVPDAQCAPCGGIGGFFRSFDHAHIA
jgi:hypothetical protein